MAVPDLSARRLPDEADDIQGIVRTGFGTLKHACFLLLRIVDVTAARAWLASADVTLAARRDDTSASALQIALTARGLRALGLPGAVMQGFSAEFLSGMAGDAGRSRRLGDVGANAPSAWRWGGAEEPDVLVMLYAPKEPAQWRHHVETPFFARGFQVQQSLVATDMGGREPFGFADGISQPRLDWAGARGPSAAQELAYTNLIAPGEVLLGYKNEYGLYTDRPLLTGDVPGVVDLPEAVDRRGWRDLGRNGSYLVFRELHQDVRKFWDFMREQAGDDAVALAEAMVGRRMDGAPMADASAKPILGVGPKEEDIKRNQFTYDADAMGVGCPIGAHVRRANPRTADMPGGEQSGLARLIRVLGFCKPDLREDLVAASRFHRILRRGRPFGVGPDVPAAADVASGLYFICLNANIPRQFEFIQNAWMHSAKFAGLSGEGDPITGNREEFPPGQATDGFSMPAENGVQRRVEGLLRFVTVRGGAYFFLPGLRALRFIARETG